MLIIGSWALKIRAPHLLNRKPSDIDLFATMDEIKSLTRAAKFHLVKPTEEGRKYIVSNETMINDIEVAWTDSLPAQLIELVAADPDTLTVPHPLIAGLEVMVPSLAVLAELKGTHKYLKNSPHFLKTMRDIQTFRSLGLTLKDQYKDWFKARIKETYNYSHPKLNQNKHNFFTDDVAYVHDHDSIHEAVKRFARPAYSYFQADGEEVAVSKEKFFACVPEIQLASVVEEACVLAIERSLVPYPDAKTTEEAFVFALQKVCTSITSGWWRAYAYDNYDAACFLFVQAYQDYFERFKVALEAGQIKAFEGKYEG